MVDSITGCGPTSSTNRQLLSASRRLKILAWLPRIPASFSLFGSIFIIVNVLRKKKYKKGAKYSLLLSISVCDCVSSTAWALSTLPVPQYDDNGNLSPVYGAKGNEATCRAQGFFVQFGFTSVFCNLALAVYYVLVITHGWSEERIKKRLPLLLIAPFIVGLTLAVAGLPFYGPGYSFCYVFGDEDKLQLLLVIFLFLPIATVIVVATCLMIRIYLTVYYKERASRKWSLQRRSMVDRLSTKVMWQAFWYLLAYYASWPIVIAVPFIETDLFKYFPYLCAIQILAPIQGFLNFLNYSRSEGLTCIRLEGCRLHAFWKKLCCKSTSPESMRNDSTEEKEDDYIETQHVEQKSSDSADELRDG